VEVVDLGGTRGPADLRGPLPTRDGHGRAEVVVAEQTGDCAGDRLRLARRHEERLAIAPDDALVAVDVGGDDRGPGRHRLEQDDPERFAARGRRDVDVGGPVELGLLLVADPAEKLDALEAARRYVVAGLVGEGPAADDEKPALAAGLAQDPVGLEQLEQALARLEPADEQDVRGPVLPAGEPHGPPEA